MIDATLEARIARIIDQKGVNATERAAQILTLPEMAVALSGVAEALQRLGQQGLQRIIVLAQEQEPKREGHHGCRS